MGLRTDRNGLAEILPEAREVFDILRPRLSSVITRGTLHRLLTEGRYKVTTFQEGVQIERTRTARELPLLTVRIERGTSQQEADVADDLGVTASQLERMTQGTWHRIGSRGALIWDTRPFSVQVSPWRQELAVPVFPHKMRDPIGYIWSGFVNGTTSPAVVQTGLKLVQEPSLTVMYEWRIDTEGVRLITKGFLVIGSVGSEAEATLEFEGQPLWHGRLRNSQPFQRVSPGAARQVRRQAVQTNHIVRRISRILSAPIPAK